MVLKTEFHLWTLKSQMLIADTGLGCLSYHDKTDKASYTGVSASSYMEEKQAFLEGHGKMWIPKNKRPEKQRDSLREFEELMNSSLSVFTHWMTTEILQVLFANGTVYWLTIDHQHGDIIKITKDTSLIAKLSLTSISDVAFGPNCVVLSSMDKCQLEIVNFTKPQSTDNSHHKIGSREPKITLLDLPGRSGRSLNRKLRLLNEQLIVYWPNASEEAWPWAPMSNEEERANMCLVSLSPKPRVVAYTRTDSEPLTMDFCHRSGSRILSVERSPSAKNPRAELCTYELTKSTVHRTQHSSVPLTSRLILTSWDRTQTSLLLACEDKSLYMHCEFLLVPLTTRAAFTPDLISWHPTSSLVAAVSQKGSIQIFDKALSCIHLTIEGQESLDQIKLSNYFRLTPLVKKVEWCHRGVENGLSTSNSLLVSVDRGPLCLLKVAGADFNQEITCMSLISEYLQTQSADKAAGLLSAMSWDLEGPACFQALSNIVNSLLKRRLTREREQLLESTLGCFYAPAKPLSEIVILEYRTHIANLARRFFHHLLRFSRFDKAFLLAVDINSRDLFLDLHYSALDVGQPALAASARAKANQCDEELMFSDSQEEEILSEDGGRSYSASSSDDSLISPQRARLLADGGARELADVMTRRHISTPRLLVETGHGAPPLPPRRHSYNVPGVPARTKIKSPPVPPRVSRTGNFPTSGDSTPPLPPRRTNQLSPHGQRTNQLSPYGQENVTPIQLEAPIPSNKYRQIAGCTLPGGYAFDLNPLLSHNTGDLENMIVDDSITDFNNTKHVNNLEKKPVKVIHFGLV